MNSPSRSWPNFTVTATAAAPSASAASGLEMTSSSNLPPSTVKPPVRRRITDMLLSHSPSDALRTPRVARMASAPPSRQARTTSAGRSMPAMGPAMPPWSRATMTVLPVLLRKMDVRLMPLPIVMTCSLAWKVLQTQNGGPRRTPDTERTSRRTPGPCRRPARRRHRS